MVVRRMTIFLQHMIEELKYEDLPSSWNTFDLTTFSTSKNLWDYQEEALQNAIKVLWKYYEGFVDYQVNEHMDANEFRKEQLFQWYQDNGLDENLDIEIDERKSRAQRNIYKLLSEYYPVDGRNFAYQHFINRMSFWMATGTGKSLVIIKLIEILIELIERKEIPPHDILILTHRDDLLEQFEKHVDEFNYLSETKINLVDLKEYAEVKRQPSLLGIPVFYYRSDNLSDEQKDKIIDFRNYDNDGKWYIFLDEAHKGDKEESKRQHIYSILSRNGFLFNFSATFTDERDIVTCAYEFNLSSFINSGYGKHISIMKQEIRAFKDKEDYNAEEKQKIVLKSLILLTYIKKCYKAVSEIDSNLYHDPLLLTLVHTVNTKDADLKMFFRELERIGKGEVEDRIFEAALDELWEELREEPEFMFEAGEKLKTDRMLFRSITKSDVLEYVYNADSGAPGDIEVLRRQSDRKELAFKLKTSNQPFALIKIGDISNWLEEELVGYEIQERFEDESYFENLNRDDSPINILMGSHSFYEGWDSNRPNVINFINIGVGENARKFILQSVGRGVRIEPLEGKRKRLQRIYNTGEIDPGLYRQIRDKVAPLETLFVLATNRKALQEVISGLAREKENKKERQVSLFENPDVHKHRLLVPVYKLAGRPLLDLKKEVQIKFDISARDLRVFRMFSDFITDDRVFLMRYQTEPSKIRFLRDNLEGLAVFKIIEEEKNVRDVDLLTQRFFDYLDVIPEELDRFEELEDEIRHFKNVKVHWRDESSLREIDNFEAEIHDFLHLAEPRRSLEELREKLEQGHIDLDEYTRLVGEYSIRDYSMRSAEKPFEYGGDRLKLKYITNHYYFPVIISEDEKVKHIKHIIKTPSEVKFIQDLDAYIKTPDNQFLDFDWWLFSKIDESLDDVYIPYYNPKTNRISAFYPDFVFWLQKKNEYTILFVDPKGTEHTDVDRKIDGYKNVFEENGTIKEFCHNGLKIRVKLLLRADDIARVPMQYRDYWFDRIDTMLETTCR